MTPISEINVFISLLVKNFITDQLLLKILRKKSVDFLLKSSSHLKRQLC